MLEAHVAGLEKTYTQALDDVKASSESPEECERNVEQLMQVFANPNVQWAVIVQNTHELILNGKPLEEASLDELLGIAYRLDRGVEMTRESFLIIERKDGMIRGALAGEGYQLAQPRSEVELTQVKAQVQALPEAQKQAITDQLRYELIEDEEFSGMYALGAMTGQWVKENPEQALSVVLDWTPGVSFGKALVEVVIGMDPITKEPITRWVAIAGIVPIGKIVATGGKAIKAVAKGAKAVEKYGGVALGDKAIGVVASGAKAAGKYGDVVLEAAHAEKAVEAVAKGAKAVEKYGDEALKKAAHTRPLTALEKGKLGEIAAERTMLRVGYKQMPSKLPGNQGFDGVFVKRNAKGEVVDIVLGEAKFAMGGKARLSETAHKGTQMSQKWIDKTIKQMQESSDNSLKELGDFLNLNKDKIRPKINVLDGEGVNRWNKFEFPIPNDKKQ